MRIRPTGVSLPAGFGLQWEFVPGDKEVARETIIFLEDRRVLHGPRYIGDEKECVHSVIQIRNKLTKLITAAKPGEGLEESLRAMRAVCARFVTQGGPGAVKFRGLDGSGDNYFGHALRELQTAMGLYILLILEQYDLEVEERLASILPSGEDADLSWLPGFGPG
jgi:hypothetical protein